MVNLVIKMRVYFFIFNRYLVRYFAAILFSISCAFSYSGQGLADQHSIQPLRIGTFLAITGQASFIGAPALATLKLYVNLLNAQGGLLGRKLELIDYDVGIDPRK